MAEDTEFLLQLFRESQQGLIAALGAAAEPLIAMQYRGRAASYAVRAPGAENWILLDSEGRPAGRLLLDRRPGSWRVMDLAVSAACQRQGLGSGALRACQSLARQAGCGLELQTAPGNPARGLYQKLGFVTVREDQMAVEMLWLPASDEAGNE